MRWIKQLLAGLIDKYSTGYRYKIIDFKNQNLTVFCNWTKQVFTINLYKILNHDYVVTNMPPDQACFIGLKLGNEIINGCITGAGQGDLKDNIVYYSTHKLSVIINREGKVKLLSVPEFSNRFVCPMDIARSKEKVNLLKSSEAMGLGIHISLHKDKLLRKTSSNDNVRYLKIVPLSGHQIKHS